MTLPIAEQRLSKERLCELGTEMTKRRVVWLAPQAGQVAASTSLGFSGSTTAWVVGAVSAVLALAVANSKKTVEV